MDVARRRVAIVIGLCALLVVVAGGAFDGLQWELFGSVAVVGGAALLVVERRVLTRIIVMVAGVVVGVGLAVVLAGGGVADVGRAAVRGPRQLLTTEWPSPAVPSIVGAVALLIAVTTAVAADLAGRRRFHLAPLAAVAAGWVASLAIGAPVRPSVVLLVLGGAGAVLLSLLRIDSDASGRSVRSDRTLAVSLGAVVTVAAVTAGAVAWADRADPRRTQDADLNAPVIDPIEASVALRRAEPVFPVFAITDRSQIVGQSLPARWRTAALDTYDGQRWVPRLELRPIGGRLGLPRADVVDLPPPIDFDLEFRSDDVVLLPFPGEPLSASIDVETDLGRVVVRPLERPELGSTVSISSEVALNSRSRLPGFVARRPVDEVAGGFTDEARRLAGSGTEVEQLRSMEAAMRDEWQLDSSAPGAGQQLALIERFVVDTNRGTREQFVTAFVLLARSLGYDARIATGFVAPPEASSSPLVLSSDMAATWPEVSFVDVGWVAFDPVPSVETAADDEDEPQPEAQTPAAAQPPIAPPSDDTDEDDDEVVEVAGTSDPWSGVRRWLVRVGVVGAFSVLPVALVIGTIIGLKWRRRRRRRHHPDPAQRIRGVWANVTDALVDAGLVIAPSWTDDRIAEAAAGAAPAAPHEVRRLAAMSTQMTFGPTHRADAIADDAVSTSRSVEQAIRADRSRWQRLLWRLSLRSLRPSTRSPVQA